ncbi:bifunctional proline dehydrogenase/pyrroline-5-carboxylate dehydrogenase [Planctomycetes bacterium Poly30]|uniref:Bifunctional proline dehydrogenase/pyrroline-5-carboxylate dehydrogenase n=1 Tax=Saltatorellus ferox TaxID=2528018 RepID=A0A518EKR9_9BACT|nr:bifunctional proline dehydrogenase/pyrroline-5-carboxylate dehydrogenase [Planctomycetes bacterium Poly30]
MNQATPVEGPSPSPVLGPTPAVPLPDFGDTEKTFSHLSDGELKFAGRLFGLMGRSWLSDNLSRLGTWAVRWRLPLAEWGVRNTIYRQFVGGTSLQNALPTIERLFERGVTSIMDYGAEAKSSEADFDRFRDEILKAAKLSGSTEAVDSVVVKVTGLAPNELLERSNERTIDFTADQDPEFQRVIERLDQVCRAASDSGIEIYIDAEETWFQGTIDQLADEMMRRYNRERVVVLNTFQLYRHDRLAFLKSSHERAREHGYRLGCKLVRGAYMEKEAARAKERGYPTPIQPSLQATHDDYNAAVEYCVDHIEEICSLAGTHNEESVRRLTVLLDERGIPRNHPHARCAQLLGMSDNLTFNLAAAGYNASKYMVYGPVSEVLPYLVRRAQENTSVTGEMGRELKLIKDELRRRRRS